MIRRSSQRFVVNGVTYTSLDEVPQPDRDSLAALLADADGDGVPDIVQGRDASGSVAYRLSQLAETIEVDGVVYETLDDIPEPRRSQVRDAMARQKIDVPPAATSRRPDPTPMRSPTPAPAPVPAPIITEAGPSSRTKLLMAFIAIDVAIAAAVIWFVAR